MRIKFDFTHLTGVISQKSQCRHTRWFHDQVEARSTSSAGRQRRRYCCTPGRQRSLWELQPPLLDAPEIDKYHLQVMLSQLEKTSKNKPYQCRQRTNHVPLVNRFGSYGQNPGRVAEVAITTLMYCVLQWLECYT